MLNYSVFNRIKTVKYLGLNLTKVLQGVSETPREEMKGQETWGDGSRGLGRLLSMGRQLSASWTVDSRRVRQIWGGGRVGAP